MKMTVITLILKQSILGFFLHADSYT